MKMSRFLLPLAVVVSLALVLQLQVVTAQDKKDPDKKDPDKKDPDKKDPDKKDGEKPKLRLNEASDGRARKRA